MKICTFNANGIRSAIRKGFWAWFENSSIDVLCIQETKAQLDKLKDISFPEGYHLIYNDALKPGYSGVAILSKIAPLSTEKTFDFELCNNEGRMAIMHFKEVSIASVYFPSGTSGDARQDLKMQFLEWINTDLFKAYKEKSRSLIVCADVNIAHRAIDLKNDKANEKNSGYLPEERQWMDELLATGWIDTHRHIIGTEEAYTWWTYRQNARARDVGWRIDYQIVSEDLEPFINHAYVQKDPIFSDHAPLIVEYHLTLS